MQKIVGGYLIESEYDNESHRYKLFVNQNGLKSWLNSYEDEDEIAKLSDAEILEMVNIKNSFVKQEKDAFSNYLRNEGRFYW